MGHEGMADEMRDELTISLSIETLGADGFEPPEERATFGLLSMTANDRLLTGAQEVDGGELRRGPHIAGYPLAEWLVWNWWRIRWECRRPTGAAASDWEFAHRMTTVGEGYAWPGISIFSDGRHAFLVSEPSGERSALPIRYIGAAGHETVSASGLEASIDGFVAGVLARLDAPATRETNLHRLWEDLQAERENPEHARFRRFEARLGCDPDDIPEDTIRARLDDAAALGEEALGEIAAAAAVVGEGPDRMMSAADIAETAASSGFDADPGDAVTLSAAVAPDAEAWRAGVRMAQELREREGLNGHPIPNARLAAFAGTTADAISRHDRRSEKLSFVLNREDGGASVALRSKWETGRRFDLARLVGDRAFGAATGSMAEPLWPATGAYSYRQKMQRAFAAELLCPFAAVDEMTRSDDSGERQRDVAERFNVSELTVRTQLVNGGRIDRDSAPDVAARGPWN